MKYVPPVIIEEMEQIKQEHGLEKEVEAFNKLVKYAQLGREIERIKKPPRGLF